MWIVMLMVTLLVLSMLVTIIRGVNSRLNSNTYVPLERACPDYWEYKNGWCMADDDKLKPDASCFSGLDVEIEPTTGRVQKMKAVTQRDKKLDIASTCHLPWDGISNTNSPVQDTIANNSCN